MSQRGLLACLLARPPTHSLTHSPTLNSLAYLFTQALNGLFYVAVLTHLDWPAVARVIHARANTDRPSTTTCSASRRPYEGCGAAGMLQPGCGDSSEGAQQSGGMPPLLVIAAAAELDAPPPYKAPELQESHTAEPVPEPQPQPQPQPEGGSTFYSDLEREVSRDEGWGWQAPRGGRVVDGHQTYESIQ